jgi:hypothetical protein
MGRNADRVCASHVAAVTSTVNSFGSAALVVIGGPLRLNLFREVGPR